MILPFRPARPLLALRRVGLSAVLIALGVCRLATLEAAPLVESAHPSVQGKQQDKQQGKKSGAQGMRKESPASKNLREIARALAEAEARERPWATLLRGDFKLARDVLTGPPTKAATWVSSLRQLQSRLRRITEVDLTPHERARAASLSGWIRALRTLEEAQATRRTDPLVVTREVERVLLTLLGAETLTPAHRLTLGEAYVARLPERWQRAREGMTTPVRTWALEAAEEIVVIERLLQDELPKAAMAAEIGERALVRLLERLEAAAVETASFREWLIEVPGATGRPRRELGNRAFEVVVGALTGKERSARELRAELLEVIARDDHGRLTAAEARPSVAQAPASMKSAMRLGLRAGRQLYAAENLSEFGPAPKVSPGLFPGGASPTDIVRLVPAPDGSFLLSVEFPDPTWTGALKRGLAGLASPLTISAEGLRRGPSGEALLRTAHAALPEDQRMPFLLEPFVEGFGLYSIDAATRFSIKADENLAATLARGGARLRLLEAARLLAALEIHAERLNEGEVLDGFRLRTGVAIEVAREEVDRVWHEPMRGAAILGYLEFRSLEDSLAEAMPRSDAARRTIALALGAPGVRPIDLLGELTGAGRR